MMDDLDKASPDLQPDSVEQVSKKIPPWVRQA